AAPPAAEARKAPPPPCREGAGTVRLDAYGDPLPQGALARVGTVRFRSGGGEAFAVAITPDGRTVFSLERAALNPHADVIAGAWDSVRGRGRLNLTGEAGRLGDVGVSPAGRRLAAWGRLTGGAGGQQGVLWVWDLEAAPPRLCVKHSLKDASCCGTAAFSPD